MHQALLDEEERRAAAAPAPAAGPPATPPRASTPSGRTLGGEPYKPPTPRNIQPKSLLVVRGKSGSFSDLHVAQSLPSSPYFTAQPIDVPVAAQRVALTPPRSGSRQQAHTLQQSSHVLLSSSLSTSSAARYQLQGSQPAAALGQLSYGTTPTARLQPLYMQSLAHVGSPIGSPIDAGAAQQQPAQHVFSANGTPNHSPTYGATPALSLPPSIALTSISSSQIPSAKDELRLLWRLSWPVAMAILFRVAMIVTDLAMLGHRSTHWLAAAAAAAIWLNISSAFLYRAFGASLNTLCSQAFGAGNFRLVGLWLQQALLFGTLASVLVGVAWVFTGPILRALSIEPDVADLAETFAHWSLIWLLPQVWMDLVQRYFQAQHIVLPALALNAVFVVVNALLNLLLLYGIPRHWCPRGLSASLYEDGWDGLGFKGSPIATAISRWMMLLCYVFYCFYWRGFHKKTFRRWDLTRRGALHPARVRQYLLAQVLPGSIGICLEEWQLEVVAIFATRLGSAEIATHNATLELFFFLTSAMFGLVAAVQIRTALYLGAGNGQAARQVGSLGLKVSVAIGLVVGSLFVLCRAWVGRVFSSDPEIWSMAQRISVLVGASYAALSVFYTAMAVLNGQARPLSVAVAYLVGCWVVCIPLSYALAFPLGQGLLGLWYGLAAGYGVVTAIVAYKAYTSDWDRCVREAQARAESAKVRGAKLAEDGEEDLEGEEASAAATEASRESRARRRERRRQRRAAQQQQQAVAIVRSASTGSVDTRLVGSVDDDPDSINRPALSPLRASPRAALTILSDTRAQLASGGDRSNLGSDSDDDIDDSLSGSSGSASGDDDDAWNAEELHYRDLQLRQQRAALAAATTRSGEL